MKTEASVVQYLCVHYKSPARNHSTMSQVGSALSQLSGSIYTGSCLKLQCFRWKVSQLQNPYRLLEIFCAPMKNAPWMVSMYRYMTILIATWCTPLRSLFNWLCSKAVVAKQQYTCTSKQSSRALKFSKALFGWWHSQVSGGFNCKGLIRGCLIYTTSNDLLAGGI